MQRDRDDRLVVAGVVADGLARGDVPQPRGLVRRGGHLVTVRVRVRLRVRLTVTVTVRVGVGVGVWSD